MPPKMPVSAPAPIRRNPWDRYASETDEEYRAFLDFLEMSRPRKVISLAHAYPTAGLSLWCRKNRWMERTAAWDEHLAGIELKEIEYAAEVAGREVGKVYTHLSKQSTDLLAIELALKLKEARERARTTGASSMSIMEIARLLDIAQKVENLANGRATSILRSDVDLSKLSPEKLEALEAILAEAETNGDEEATDPH